MAADSQNAIEGALGLGLFLLMLFGGVYFGPTVLRYVNKHWPKALTRSTKTRIIHDVHAPTTQESQREAAESSKKRSSLSSILSKSKSADGMVRPVSPSQQHNHRRLTQLQQLQLLSHSNSSTIVSSNKTNDVDRTSLELFFHTTHKSDSDWTSLEQGGNGRSNWLDRSKDIERWQGVTVGTVLTVREKEDVGRVIKLQLPKNNINGCLDALQPLTAILKISLWHNSIGGSLNGLRDMKKLQQLDLSKNSLTGTLEPLSGLSMLEELNLGYNNLEGTLDCISTLISVSRFVVNNNILHGKMNGFEAMKKIEFIDVSDNPKLSGKLPLKLHNRWNNGKLRLISTNTNVGRDEEWNVEMKEEDALIRQLSKEEDTLMSSFDKHTKSDRNSLELDIENGLKSINSTKEVGTASEVKTSPLNSPSLHKQNIQFHVLQRILLHQHKFKERNKQTALAVSQPSSPLLVSSFAKTTEYSIENGKGDVDSESSPSLQSKSPKSSPKSWTLSASNSDSPSSSSVASPHAKALSQRLFSKQMSMKRNSNHHLTVDDVHEEEMHEED